MKPKKYAQTMKPAIKPVIKPGDIWLVKFHPSTGSELTKYRPAVIITDLYSLDSRFTTIAPLTTNLAKQNQFEFLIDHQALEHQALLLGWYLWTIDTRRLISKLGELPQTEFKQITKKIGELL